LLNVIKKGDFLPLTKEVNPNKLIWRLADELKNDDNVKPPAWAKNVKTGVNSERPPSQSNWWYLRASAILRKIHLTGPVGTNRLRTVYGSLKNRGVRPSHHAKAGGKIIRLMLQQLEKSGYVKKSETLKKGRITTPKGQRLINKIAKAVR